MPRRLILIRHAKSSWNNQSADDHDRKLNKRGEQDAPVMGSRLLEHGARPSLILTSTAKRARKTARIIARALNYPIEFIQGEKELYLASPSSILRVIGQQEAAFNEVMLFGHNPGITELANQLTGVRIDNVPTCGIVAIDVNAPDWGGVDETSCEMGFFDYPKKPEADKH